MNSKLLERAAEMIEKLDARLFFADVDTIGDVPALVNELKAASLEQRCYEEWGKQTGQ